MNAAGRLRDWAAGWADLAHHGDIPGYRARGRLARLRLELAVLAGAAGAPGTWGAALACAAVGLAGQVLAWELDLGRWPRDALTCLPVLLAAPWVAAARRRRLLRLLDAADEDANAVTARAPAARHSARVAAAEPGSWWASQRTMRKARSRCPPGAASAGSTSSWRSRASARWRRWRCRGSAT